MGYYRYSIPLVLAYLSHDAMLVRHYQLIQSLKPVFHYAIFSREQAKSECDWVGMSSVFVASQSSCFFLCSREQIRQVENRLTTQSGFQLKTECRQFDNVFPVRGFFLLSCIYFSLQGGKLRKANLSGSVESALDSFSFLDLTEVGVKPEHEMKPSDTGYFSSTDETPKSGQTTSVRLMDCSS